jgi:aminodeoxyfutalosine synthase
VEVVTGLHALAERVSAGDRVTEADAQILLDSHDLITIGTMADEVRRRLHGERTTFVRVFDVHVDAPPASLPSPTSAGEIRLVGTPSSLESAIEVVSAAGRLAGSVPLTGFSIADLVALGKPLRDVASRLRDAGLHAVAEVQVDGVVDAKAVSAVRDGGLAAYRLTVQQYGDVPAATIVGRAVELQRTAGEFRAFAPLPRVVAPLSPTTGYDDVKLVAMARLLAADIPSIQVDWPLYGPKLAQVALTMGADDLDGIAAFDPGTLGTRRSALAEVTGNIRAAALEPVERNGRFESTA